MGKQLKVTYGGMDLFDGEVGTFSWKETPSGGISVSAEPPREPGSKQSNPALRALGESLRSASKAGAANAAADVAKP